MADRPLLFAAVEQAQRQIDASAQQLAASMRALTASKPNREARRAQAREARRQVHQHTDEVFDVVRATQRLVAERNRAEEARRLEREESLLRRSEVLRIARSGPLKRVLDSHAATAADEVERLLAVAARRSMSSEETARRMTELIGGDPEEPKGLHARSRLIARTELARADRAAKAVMWARDPSVELWQWKARLASNTCPMCWAMHGTLHPADEPMATHVGCLCVMVPMRDGQKLFVPGEEQFERLDDDAQLLILGPTRKGSYDDGRLTITADVSTGVVVPTTSPLWGPGRRVRPLR